LEFQSEQPKLPIMLERILSLYKILLKCFIKKEVLDHEAVDKINVNNPRNYLDGKNVFWRKG
jgi:hypothetical protein